MLGLSGQLVMGECMKCSTKHSRLYEFRPGWWICRANACWDEEVERESLRHEGLSRTLEDYRRLVGGTNFGEELPVASFALADRTSGQVWAFKVSDGELTWVAGASGGRAEPVVLDRRTTAHWRLFVSGGEVGLESTTDELSGMVLKDAATGDVWDVLAEAGQLLVRMRCVP